MALETKRARFKSHLHHHLVPRDALRSEVDCPSVAIFLKMRTAEVGGERVWRGGKVVDTGSTSKP